MIEDDIPVPESAPENWDYVHGERQTDQLDNEDTGDEDKSYIDPQEAFNRKWGYLPPLDEEAIKVIDFIIANPAMAKSQMRVQAGTVAFEDGLDDRNVVLIPSNASDSCKNQIQLLDIEDFMSERKEEKTGHDALWILDQAKITATSSEAIFQRTIMVSLVARHFLIYQRNSNVDQFFEFSVEETWACPPMPSRVFNAVGRNPASDENPVRIPTPPKPDLAVAFNRRAIINDDVWEILTLPMRQLASFEKGDQANFNVFHFLSIEAKKCRKINPRRESTPAMRELC